MLRRQILSATAFCLIVLLSIGLSAGDRPLPKPNYDLASRWMAAKVGKLIFDTGIAPRWADTSDRFWYAFETAQGRKFMLVDPLKRTKAPLWDNAKMAAMLTGITRIPYDVPAPADHAGHDEVGEERHGDPVRARGAEGRGHRGGEEARSQ